LQWQQVRLHKPLANGWPVQAIDLDGTMSECFYDWRGNKIRETKPRAALATCP
jgi:hypothetical protein